MKKLNNMILEQILKKKQIEDLKIEYVEEKINKYFLKNGDKYKKLKKEFESKKEKILKNKLFKEIVKEIRGEIGVIYGAFLTQDFKKKNKEIKKIDNYSIDKINTLLKLHKSSRERFDFYPLVYDKIFLWKKPVSGICDLACGLNPLSYFYLKDALTGEDINYFASDLNPKDMDFLNLFFEQFNVNGVAKAYDLTNLSVLKNKNLMKCDMVFLFKVLDSLEYVKRNISKKLLLGLPAQFIVVSFPTKSLVSRKEVKIEKRNWFLKFIDLQGWKLESFEIENEVFFLIDKNSNMS